jgi:hypothetical protein
MSRLERLNDWCGEILDKGIKYDDLITFTLLSVFLIVIVTCMVCGILGGLGYLK